MVGKECWGHSPGVAMRARGFRPAGSKQLPSCHRPVKKGCSSRRSRTAQTTREKLHTPRRAPIPHWQESSEPQNWPYQPNPLIATQFHQSIDFTSSATSLCTNCGGFCWNFIWGCSISSYARPCSTQCRKRKGHHCNTKITVIPVVAAVHWLWWKVGGWDLQVHPWIGKEEHSMHRWCSSNGRKCRMKRDE